MGFARMHVFRYSRRPKTPAAERDDQVDPRIIARRATQLRTLSAEMQRADLAARVGTTERVLVERSGRATSESYHQVAVDTNIAAGSLLSVQFTGYRATLLQSVLTRF
jgi:threonylcarbamoyladenosine tRNA methylthiotransferase MtaB